jgi:hypothetical protein
MIKEYQSSRLQECCENSFTHYFWGTHYVPRSDEFLTALGRFFEEILLLKEHENRGFEDDQEEAWEDCDDWEDWEDSRVI